MNSFVVKIIDNKTAKKYIKANHYMKTCPNSVVAFGVFYKKVLSGCLTFGYSTSTKEKINNIIPDIVDGEYIEMQRMHLDDKLGHNSESYVLGEVYRLFKQNTKVKVLATHAGGCKHDCGIVYQASSWLYFGKSECSDFFLTEGGEYKNIIAPMRFGRVPKEVNKSGAQAVGEYLYGSGSIVNSFRYLYLYPLNKGLRSFLKNKSLDYPKDSKRFRRNQEWV